MADLEKILWNCFVETGHIGVYMFRSYVGNDFSPNEGDGLLNAHFGEGNNIEGNQVKRK